MQAITTDFIKEFIKANEIEFKPTQTKLCVPIIRRMCHKMSNGIKFDDIKICDDLIINGHHRYISSLMMDFELDQVPSSTTTATKEFSWDLVEFDENDWDTLAKIAHINEIDAKYNNLDLEIVTKMTTSE